MVAQFKNFLPKSDSCMLPKSCCTVLYNIKGIVELDGITEVLLNNDHDIFLLPFPEHRGVPLSSSSHHHTGCFCLLPELIDTLIRVDLAVPIVAGTPIGNDGEGGVLHNCIDCLCITWVIRPLLLGSSMYSKCSHPTRFYQGHKF